MHETHTESKLCNQEAVDSLTVHMTYMVMDNHKVKQLNSRKNK
jgi:hypothetical protein